MTPEFLKDLAYAYTMTDRCDLEERGIIDAGPRGDMGWQRFNHDFDVFLLKLSTPNLIAMAGYLTDKLPQHHVEATAAHASLLSRVEKMEKLIDAIENMISEFGDDPKAALECISEHLNLWEHVCSIAALQTQEGE